MKILVIGNCQSSRIAVSIKAMMGDFASEVRSFNPFVKGPVCAYEKYDYIFYQSLFQKHIDSHKHEINGKIVLFPRLLFRAYHPDMAYVYEKGTQGSKVVRTHTGDYSSAIIFFCYLKGVSVKTTFSLFNTKVFGYLGYEDKWDESVLQLLEEGEVTNCDLTGLLASWSVKGCFMNSINHPKIKVVADIAKLLLDRENIKYKISSVEDFVPDLDRAGAIWGCYPEIADQLGFDGYYGFCFKNKILDLYDFIEDSYQVYSQYDKKSLVIDRDLSSYEQILNFFFSTKKTKLVISSQHPYVNLADYQFWKRSISRVPVHEVDPVVNVPFTINVEEKIATAGSCFAQHISRSLSKNGFNYYVSEPPDVVMTESEAHKRNFGIFSARFGNLYTARQLLQLFDRAFSTFNPIDSVWKRPDGRFVDPFRPQVEPDGYNCEQDVIDSRLSHFEKVRKMFINLDVFVFTLGLTESWKSNVDGAVFPLAPGVVAGEMNNANYSFINFDVNDVSKDIYLFIDRLHKINPSAKVILTISPVPLIATYEKKHVLTSTVYSKSVLRSAVEGICDSHSHVAYFPSYEIITGSFNKGLYFKNDLRGVTNAGISHVMKLFFKHYGKGESKKSGVTEIDSVFNIICDEEKINI